MFDAMFGMYAMWLQHDGAPAYFAKAIRDYLNNTFQQLWIGCGGPVPWPTPSPDLSCLDFLFLEVLKTMVYEMSVDTDLVTRISVAATNIQKMPIFERVRQSMRRHCEACICVNGSNFEHLL